MLWMARANLRISLATWSASSLVGQSTRDWIRNRLTSSFCSSPRPKATVFPEPVFAWPITSTPSRIGGKLWACIGVVVWYPNVERFLINDSCSLRSEKGG